MTEGANPPAPAGFSLNDWKAQFQNNKTKPAVALEWLWKNYEPANWSFWAIEYKYNDEIKQGFMASNAIKGLVQRWEHARKVAFGIVSVLKGTETQFIQCACFLTKGADVPPEIAVQGKDDYELYNWVKLDPVGKPDDKAIIESFFSFGDDVLWKGQKREHIDGLKFL